MKRLLMSLSALLVVLSACDSGPRALVAGEDSCRYCRMTITDVRFGAMVMTARGRIETFDSIECLASFVLSLPQEAAPRGVWVANFSDPNQWVEATRARFLHESSLRSPMGRELAAFGADALPDALQRTHGGTIMEWPAVLELVRARAFGPTGAPIDAPVGEGASDASSLPAHTH